MATGGHQRLLTSPLAGRPGARRRRVHAAPTVVLVGGCVVLAALSLLLPWSLAFDADAWVGWGRDVTRLQLDTGAGPSWKPLPVVFTTPFALFGDAAPALWLVVARAGGLLAVAGVAALAAMLAGRGAAVVAAAVVLLSPWWFKNTALGNSEGLLVAAVAWAPIAHLRGRPGAALALGLAAALLRPEIWPFIGLYAALTWGIEPRLRPAIAGGTAVWLLLWFGPDVAGIGGAFGASDAARGPATSGSAANAAVPFLAVLGDAAQQLTIPALVAAAYAVWRPPEAFVRWIAGAAVTYVLIVAVETQAGYAGNPRYLAPAAALGAALAGIGAAEAGAALRRPGLVGAVLVAAVAAITLPGLADDRRELVVRADMRQSLDVALRRAGGVGALDCGAPYRTSIEQRALVPWRLDIPVEHLTAPTPRGAVVLRARPYGGAAMQPRVTGGTRLVARAPGWEIWSPCRSGAASD